MALIYLAIGVVVCGIICSTDAPASEPLGVISIFFWPPIVLFGLGMWIGNKVRP